MGIMGANLAKPINLNKTRFKKIIQNRKYIFKVISGCLQHNLKKYLFNNMSLHRV